MATTYATEVAGYNEDPPEKSLGAVQGGRMVRYRATIDLDGQASGDDIILANVRDNANFAFGVITTDTSLDTSTLDIGHGAAYDEYATGLTLTATDTPTFFGAADAIAADPNDGEIEVRAVVGVAALPASGTLVIDLYYSKA